jgi:formylglycine-generating enzyme required for sulfatase activity
LAGGAGFRYPWGEEWAQVKANSKELNLERTTPVGLFPDGASAEGLLDLAGNVWEWCSTAYAQYPYDAGDGREELGGGASRVLRGGAWWNDKNRVRCASRDSNRPVTGTYVIGFRVARSSSR